MPPAPAPERLITELSAEERADWCDWFVNAASGPGYAERPDAPVQENGVTSLDNCSYGHEAFPCNAAVGSHSRRQCAENLALSSCEAPISELTDCVGTIYSQACTPLEHGCARLFEREGCSDTIVIDLDAHPEARPSALPVYPGCGIRVQ